VTTRPDRVLLCVSGGIAAYKAPEIVRAFVAAGIEVRVVTTKAALAFVTEMSLATVSKHPVRTALLDTAEEGRAPPGGGPVGHIELADWPDLVVVAPATADVIARAAAGLADDLVTVCLLATRAPVLWAPAMNTNMWRHPATVANLAVLGDRGAEFVGPDRGELACGWIGEGRMIDPPEIVAAARTLLVRHGKGVWAGRHVLVSAGPTRAYLDPVRFLTNASTGAMGFAIAAEAAKRGAATTLVAGPVAMPTPPGVARIDVETAEQMLVEMDRELSLAPHELVAMVAAVADVAPRSPRADKLDKGSLLEVLAERPWVEGIDVLTTLTGRHGDRSRFLGFAAQTASGDAEGVRAELVAEGAAKLRRKGVHALFVNRVGVPDTGFGSPTNAGILLRARGDGIEALDSGAPRPKAELAAWLLDRWEDA
jgi:phosphopantothenoylcysteine decarboxylase/phosphopantothenate--cysteine ligase